MTNRRRQMLIACVHNPLSLALVSFFVSVQLLALFSSNTRLRSAWFVLVPPSAAQRNESLARDFERILDSMKTNESTFGTVEPNKRLVMVGVMTARKLLSTRAHMIYSTWAKRVPGKVHFFSSADSVSEISDDQLPLVALPGVDDTYPPQKKSFMMLKFIYDNYADQFEWFMRMDDDVYVRTERLEAFLNSINSSQPLLIGQPGQGNDQEFGKLDLTNQENFCMGGPGMIFSRAALKIMADNISACTNNMRTFHEDLEVGRCLTKLSGYMCTWNYEVGIYTNRRRRRYNFDTLQLRVYKNPRKLNHHVCLLRCNSKIKHSFQN